MKRYGKFAWAMHILAALSVSITMACSGGCASKTDKAPSNEIQTPAEAAQTTEEEAIIKEAASEPPLNEVTDIPTEAFLHPEDWPIFLTNLQKQLDEINISDPL